MAGSTMNAPVKSAQATVQQGVVLAATLKGRALVAIGELQKAASETVFTPIAKRIGDLRSSAAKGRATVFQFVNNVVGTATGMVAWTVAEVKGKGVRTCAFEAARVAGIKTQALAGAAKLQTGHLLHEGKSKAITLAAGAREVAKNKSFQTTAASAAGGAVTLGTTGGVAGLATGTAVGAAVGVPAAFFTFGLSIPIGAAIGGTCGMVTGAAAGGTVGAVGAGAAGYGAYQKRDQITSVVSSSRNQIASVASKTMTSVNDSAGFAKEKAVASAEYVKDRACVVRTRLVGGGTGSTGDRD